MRKKVRERGARFMKIIQEEYPNVSVMGLGLSSFAKDLAKMTPEERAKAWPTHGYGLLPAFTSGMASESKNAKLIDGVEFTYDYIHPTQFDTLNATVSEKVVTLMDPADKALYQKNIQISTAVYVDGIMNQLSYPDPKAFHYFGWWLDTDAQRLKIMENNIYHGCRVSQPFMWIYSEHTHWVAGTDIPAGLENSILRTKDKVTKGQPLGFSIQDLWDLVQSRKSVGHK